MNDPFNEYKETMKQRNFLRQFHFEYFKNNDNKGLLNFQTTEIHVGDDVCLLYDIPMDKMQEILDKINPFKEYACFPINSCSTIPTLGDHKKYYFRDAKIIYFNGYNYIVPPMFFESGVTSEGWYIDL